jgi:hypothetical protein
MARGGHLAVPQLDGVPCKHELAVGIEPAARVGRDLLQIGIADAEDWARARKRPVEFVERTLNRWATAHGANEIATEFELSLTLVSDLDPYDDYRAAANRVEEMYLVIEPESAAYLVLGPLLRKLENLHPRLPLTFSSLFTNALNRWVRVYDYRDALERVDMLREWYESDPEGEQVELPDIDGATPACLRNGTPLKERFVERLALTAPDEAIRTVLRNLLEMSRESNSLQRPEIGADVSERLMDCNPPLPALLAVFEKRDAIEGCFDEESQSMMECQPEPNIILPLKLGNLESVGRALATAGVACNVLRRAANLIKIVMSKFA